MFFVDLLVGVSRICSVISIQAFRCFPQNGFLPLLPLTLPSLRLRLGCRRSKKEEGEEEARVIEKTGYSTSTSFPRPIFGRTVRITVLSSWH